MNDTDIEALRADAGISTKLWGRTFSALSAMTYREKGEDAVNRLWVKFLRQHQTGFYQQGLRKLGIRDEESPAIKAAKYHYFTNLIGGLDIEYVEESPRKVWIRYTAPMWTFAGVTMMAMPASIRRNTFTAWHPRNGALMGCPRLGWVSTKFITEGEACDEGYFYEYDHDLEPGGEFRYEVATHTPEFDPSKAPELDPVAWPEARKLKANRNWSREYVKTVVDCLYQLFGEQATYYLVAQTMRGLATQFTHELKQQLQVEGRDTNAVATFLFRLAKACGQDVEMTQANDAYRIVLRTHLPFEPDAPERLRVATFEFPLMAARLINGRTSVTRSSEGQAEIWEIRDEGRWLY